MRDSINEGLKSCPCCGNLPMVYEWSPGCYCVQCGRYACNFPYAIFGADETSAIRAWNEDVNKYKGENACNYITKTLKDPDNDKVLYETREYKPSKCVKDKCPFYWDGEDDFTPETCIKAEKEKEQ